MALKRQVTGILLGGTLGIIPAIGQTEDLLKNADIAYGEYLAGECVTSPHILRRCLRNSPSLYA